MKNIRKFETTAAMDAATLEDVSINYNVETNGLLSMPLVANGKNIITFNIKVSTIQETKEYKAEEGMTWEQWCQSEYNTNDWEIDADSIIGFVETWNEGSFGQGGLYNIVIYNGQCIKYPDIVKPVTYTTHVDGWGLGNP